ncbi:MAG: T9SS type A sorting domain-containing protein [Bacteroidetes bacterium]|nr:T9SS type A sorting domain-containing protein [Bacteroidota bacterium]
MKFTSLLFAFLVLSVFSRAQITKKVCFLGNSYVYTNDLPGIISNMAAADGNTLIKDQNTPGGYTLEGHASNTTSLAKISSNTWDFVVLQDQSQLPSFPWSQVETDVLPFAEILCDSIRSANPCAIPLFFDTWGRQNGDPQWDSIDTFTEMNQRLYNAYEYMANANSGMLSPVGIAYEHVANDVSATVGFSSLYVSDESHPTIFGSYLSACVFYELIYASSSVGNTYLPAGINAPQAAYLQGVAHHVLTVVDSVETAFIDPVAAFSFTVNGNEVSFTNESLHDFEWLWNFGDGNTSATENPTHVYTATGTYPVELIAYYCDRSDTLELAVATTSLSVDAVTHTDVLRVYPNPSTTGEMTLSGLDAGTPFSVYSADGRLVQNLVMPQEPALILNLQPGIYFLKTKTSSLKLLVL